MQVDQAKYGEITNYAWSPDSKWISYDRPVERVIAIVNLYSLADGKITPMTTSMTNSYLPFFDPDGKYLYFLSDRDFNEVLGNVDFEFANPKTTRVYIATLKADEPSPFPALSDELGNRRKKSPQPARKGRRNLRPRASEARTSRKEGERKRN